MGPQEPADVIRYFERYYRQGDLAGMMSLFESQAVLRTRRSTASGSQQIREMLRAYVESGAELRFGESATFQAGDLALAHTAWQMRDAEGRQSDGVTTEVLRRQTDGTWKYVIDCPEGIQQLAQA